MAYSSNNNNSNSNNMSKYHEDSDADDEFERTAWQQRDQIPVEYESSPTSSGPLSTEHTPTTFTHSRDRDSRISPTGLIVDWSAEQVADFVSDIGLEQYCDTFVDEGITGDALVSLQHAELKEMGVGSVGHRLTMLKAVYDIKVKQNVPVEPDDYVPLCRCPVVFCFTLSCPALPVLPCPALSCMALSCPVLPCPALSCPAVPPPPPPPFMSVVDTARLFLLSFVSCLSALPGCPCFLPSVVSAARLLLLPSVCCLLSLPGCSCCYRPFLLSALCYLLSLPGYSCVLLSAACHHCPAVLTACVHC